jgi:HK97 family phage major capsid protein
MNSRKVFPNEAAARRAGIWLCDAAGAPWAKERNELPLVKALAEGVGTSGGFLVPSEISDRIVELRDQRGLFRQNAYIETMTSESTSIPRRVTGGVTAFFTSENAAITESAGGTWDSITLTAKKLSALVRASAEVTEDSAGGSLNRSSEKSRINSRTPRIDAGLTATALRPMAEFAG